jgi:hypothetical protein
LLSECSVRKLMRPPKARPAQATRPAVSRQCVIPYIRIIFLKILLGGISVE